VRLKGLKTNIEIQLYIGFAINIIRNGWRPGNPGMHSHAAITDAGTHVDTSDRTGNTGPYTNGSADTGTDPNRSADTGTDPNTAGTDVNAHAAAGAADTDTNPGTPGTDAYINAHAGKTVKSAKDCCYKYDDTD
jgi:hypothetical protein